MIVALSTSFTDAEPLTAAAAAIVETDRRPVVYCALGRRRTGLRRFFRRVERILQLFTGFELGGAAGGNFD